jgi:hypothetical protein
MEGYAGQCSRRRPARNASMANTSNPGYYYRDDNSQNRMADNDAYRYHGGPKYND